MMTRNAALPSARAFHYQVLVGIEECFKIKENQSVWFEKDGDVSLRGCVEESKQIEVKNYAVTNTLGNHHKNFWNTLKNWLDDDKFQHEKYGSLVLHTTQPFGINTFLADWNGCTAEKRLSILQKIIDERKSDKKLSEDPSASIVKLQQAVINSDINKLKLILGKFTIFTEADDENTMRESIKAKFIGIPDSNKKAYLDGLIGFVYSEVDSTHWEVSKKSFDAKTVELTKNYHKKEFTFPTFEGKEASQEETEKYEDALFVKKIKDIDHHEVVSEAVGNWIELCNSLNKSLDGYPLYREETVKYQKQLVQRFKNQYSLACLKFKTNQYSSKIFYYDMIIEQPSPMGNMPPPIAYKNGLIHDAMNTETWNLKWRIES